MFLLLKVLLWLFRPLLWIFVFLAAGRLSRRPRAKKVLYGTALGFLIFFTNPAIIRGLLMAYETAPVEAASLSPHSAGIVLGGFVSYNKTEDRGYFNAASDRFIQTALLYKTGRIRKIIVPAGNGYLVKHHFSEAEFIRNRLVALGIPATDIFLDRNSRNTLENAQNTKRIIDSLRLEGPFVLISSASHLPRARRVFDKLQVPVILFPCDFSARSRSNNFIEDYLLPSAGALLAWEGYLKELVGVVSYRITGNG